MVLMSIPSWTISHKGDKSRKPASARFNRVNDKNGRPDGIRSFLALTFNNGHNLASHKVDLVLSRESSDAESDRRVCHIFFGSYKTQSIMRRHN